MRRRNGFTLIEVLLVSSLVAGLSLAVFQALSNGLKLWDRSRVLVVDEDVAIFFDKFSADIRNSFTFSSLAFSGEENRIEFPSVVTVPSDRGSSRAAEGAVDEIGRVRYLFDSGSGSILRYQANYSQGTRDTWGEGRALVTGVSGVTFRYFSAGSQEPRTSVANTAGIPSGVEVEIRFNEAGEERSVRRYVPIPVGQ